MNISWKGILSAIGIAIEIDSESLYERYSGDIGEAVQTVHCTLLKLVNQSKGFPGNGTGGLCEVSVRVVRPHDSISWISYEGQT